MRAAAKADANQPTIVAALRAVGATVQQLHTIGKGCPDLLVGFRGENFLLELKQGSARLTPDECLWHLLWRGQKAIVRSADEALRVIGALQEFIDAQKGKSEKE